MELSKIQRGQRLLVQTIPDGPLKSRLRQFGFVEGVVAVCRLSKSSIVALEWMGTVVALRRRDIKEFYGQVIS